MKIQTRYVSELAYTEEVSVNK